MTLPYGLRLIAVCLAFFFLAHVTTGLAISCLTPAAVRVSRRMYAAGAARFLFAVRLLPFGLAFIVVIAFCIPSYLQFEPVAEREEVGVACLAAALLGLGMCVISIRRATESVIVSSRQCRAYGPSASHELVCVVEDTAPLCALSGILRPRLLISRGVIEALSPDELDVVLDHERAHLHSADNLKRLFLLMAPRYLGTAAIEREWARCAEFAADDRAGAGEPQRSLALASALVRVVRLGSSTRLAHAASFMADGNGLPERVERLLAVAGPVAQSRGGRATWCLATAAAMVAMVLAVQAASLQSIYAVLERLVH